MDPDPRLAEHFPDLSWLLLETPATFFGAVVGSYGGVDDALRERAALRAAFFPRHEALHRVQNGLPESVAPGRRAVPERLPSR